MNPLSAALWIARKDLGLYVRDKTGLALGILLPIVLVAVFGAVMQFAFGGDSGMPRVRLWIVDEDQSTASARFVDELRNVSMISVRPRAGQTPRSAERLRRDVADGEIHHALIVRSGFGDALANQQEPPLTVVRDPGRRMETRLISIALMQATMATADGSSMPWMIGSMMRRQGMSDAGVEQVEERMRTVQQVIERFAGNRDPELRADPAGDSQPGGFDMSAMFEGMVPVTHEDIAPPQRPKTLGYQLAQSVSGMTVMMLMFGLVACSTMLLVERDEGTLRRLLVSRAPRHALLLGKFLFCFCIGIVQLLVLFTFGELVFAIGAFRDPLTLLVLSITWAAAATGFGMLIAVWARTQKQAEGLSTLLILVMAALGGCWFPLQMAELPWYGEAMTRVMLTYWAMEGFQGMFWHQKSFTDPVLLRAIAVQWGFVAFASWLSWRLWTKRFAPS